MTDKAVARLKAQAIGAYRAPKVYYLCGTCGKRGIMFKTDNLLEAWVHSLGHGPWPMEGSQANSYGLNLSAQAHRNGLAHPKNYA